MRKRGQNKLEITGSEELYEEDMHVKGITPVLTIVMNGCTVYM